MSILTHPTFWKLLDKSGSIDETRGMTQIDLKTANAKLTTFSKVHSYGEYIFDWGWADAFNRHGVPYYPKLTSMVPFTPAKVQHFVGPQNEWPELLAQHEILLRRHSSAHFLFTTPEEQIFLGQNQYLLRDSFQYHFYNEGYADFEDYLSRMKSKKAKNIRNERAALSVKIERLTGRDLTFDHAQEMYDFYLMTLEEKKAIPYLTREFYQMLFQELPDNVLYVRAIENDRAIAGALFYYDEDRLYGRYWGTNTFIPHLHFELCYYQGIEFCLERKLKVFEAGAQGEHKIQRGFRPTLTTSAHKINHPDFSRAIAHYIQEEKEQIQLTMTELTKLLPFK